MITYEDFKKSDLRVAKILSAERVEGSEKLLKLEIDLGSETRQLVAGIGKYYEPSELIGREIVVVANLEPKKFMGLDPVRDLFRPEPGDEKKSKSTNLPPRSTSFRISNGVESQGMLLAADVRGRPVLLSPDERVPPGSIVKYAGASPRASH